MLFAQALSNGQSEFCTHSGRHSRYGSPRYSGMQLQIPLRHSALSPHGDGLHGSDVTVGMSVSKEVSVNLIMIVLYY